jgi:hypothetical protein
MRAEASGKLQATNDALVSPRYRSSRHVVRCTGLAPGAADDSIASDDLHALDDPAEARDSPSPCGRFRFLKSRKPYRRHGVDESERAVARVLVPSLCGAMSPACSCSGRSTGHCWPRVWAIRLSSDTALCFHASARTHAPCNYEALDHACVEHHVLSVVALGVHRRREDGDADTAPWPRSARCGSLPALVIISTVLLMSITPGVPS